MIKLATKSTRNLKLSKENKALLAKKLDSVSKKVAKRGVHVVIKHQGLYRIVEALSQSVVLDSIIYKRLAETLCVRLNRPSKHYPITSVGIKKCQDDLNSMLNQCNRIYITSQMNGEADNHTTVFLEVQSGAGGDDANDWASMLLRMYVRWADKKNFKAEILTSSPGEEAGIKSALLRITGEKVFGLLKGEKGVHRLVRLSPFNSANLRHTSFALVEVIPDFQKTVNVEVNNDDLKIEAFKASGAGGQSVQKNSSAIRLTHKPSGIVVSVQNERSQSQNKNIALQILKSRLVDLENIKNKEKENELKGEFVSAEWGNQVRSYVLHPYTLVKDIRSGFELSDAQGVLDGDLDQLLFEFLKFINKSQNHN